MLYFLSTLASCNKIHKIKSIRKQKTENKRDKKLERIYKEKYTKGKKKEKEFFKEESQSLDKHLAELEKYKTLIRIN